MTLLPDPGTMGVCHNHGDGHHHEASAFPLGIGPIEFFSMESQTGFCMAAVSFEVVWS